MQVIPWVEASLHAPGTYESWLEGARRWQELGVLGLDGRPAIILTSHPRERELFRRAQFDVRRTTVLPGLKTNPILSGKSPIAGWLEFGQCVREAYHRTGSRIIVLDNESLFAPAYAGKPFNWSDHQTGILKMAGLIQDLELWVYPGVRGLGAERDISIRLVRMFTEAPLNCRVLDTVSYWGPGSKADPEATVSRNRLEAVCSRPPVVMLYCHSRTGPSGAEVWPAWTPNQVSVGCQEAENHLGGPVLMFCGNSNWPKVVRAWLY